MNAPLARLDISPFFLQLRTAYQAEMDDLTFDSEGRDVLRQRLADKRKEFDFLRQMIELSPEMVAVIFHDGFSFTLPAVVEHLLTLEADEFPEWDTLADAVQLAPWAQALAEVILKEPMGPWFMTVAAGLVYMHGKFDPALAARFEDDHDADEDEEPGHHDQSEPADSDEVFHHDEDARTAEEAGADWLAEQGFDRKD